MIKEYLTGVSADGLDQINPALSFGNYRSSVEADSLAIEIEDAIHGIVVEFAYGDPGIYHLTLQDVVANGIVYLDGFRINATPPFSPGVSTITTREMFNNVFGFDNVISADAVAGVNQYRATCLRNEDAVPITTIKRHIVELATSQLSNAGQLGSSGTGTISTFQSFADWPTSGWCRIQLANGTLREIVYYSSRTETTLTVVSRARLGTSSTAGLATDTLHAVPGVAIGLDAVQAFGGHLILTANVNTDPGVTWNTGITEATGLSISVLLPNQQVGIWIWREIPIGAVFTPSQEVKFVTTYLE